MTYREIFSGFRNLKPLSALMFSAFVVLAVFLTIQIAAALLAIPLFGIGQVSGLLNGVNLEDPSAIALLKYFQTVQAIGLFIAPPFLIAWLLSGHITRYLCLDRQVRTVPLLMVILLVITINPFINFTGALNAEMHLPSWFDGIEAWMRETEDAARELTEAFLMADSFGGLLFNLLMIAVLPALGEELLFRGVIQKQLTQWTGNHHGGIWLAAALFSALHMQFYGFLPRMLLAGMFGYLLVWSGSLWLPILAHFINNAGAVIALWLIDHEKISPGLEEFGSGTGSWPYALASLTVGAIILYAVRQHFTGSDHEVVE